MSFLIYGLHNEKKDKRDNFNIYGNWERKYKGVWRIWLLSIGFHHKLIEIQLAYPNRRGVLLVLELMPLVQKGEGYTWKEILAWKFLLWH